MFDLSGKVAFVAGGAGHLGLPVCRGLVENGAALMLADLDEAKTAPAAADILKQTPEARVRTLTMNVGDEASITRAIAGTLQEFGRLDIVVNLAFRAAGKLVDELTAAEFDEANHVNLTGAFVLAREAARAMPRGGSIILFSSMYGQVAPEPALYVSPMKPNPLEYGVGKAGIIQMARYLAVAWASRAIRVNAIAPGPFPNPAIQRTEPAFVERLASKTPLGRIGEPRDIAGAAVFLASDEAAYITGHTLPVNGGWTLW